MFQVSGKQGAWTALVGWGCSHGGQPEAAHRQREDMKELSGKYMSGHLKMDWTSNVLIYPHIDPQSEDKSYWLKMFKYNYWPQLHKWGETPRKPCLKIKTIVCVYVCLSEQLHQHTFIWNVHTKRIFRDRKQRVEAGI